MKKRHRIKIKIGMLVGLMSLFSQAEGGDQAKSILNDIDPKVMNEFVEAARGRPDVSLANLVPASANRYRFLFVWPSIYQRMSQDRISQNFAQRLLVLADQQKLLAQGYCLLNEGIAFGTAAYGDVELNVAYREIEVRYLFGPNGPCLGRYIAAADFFRDLTAEKAASQPVSTSSRATKDIKHFNSHSVKH